jgi:hypothetical protein
VHEFVSANDDPDVRRELAHTVDGVKEHEVAGAKVARIDVGPGAKLLGHCARHAHSMLSKHVPDKPAAIES